MTFLKSGKILIATLVALELLLACSEAPTRIRANGKSNGAVPSGNGNGDGKGDGDSGGSIAPEEGGKATTLTCSTTDSVIDPGPSPLRRLTRLQYSNSATELLGALPVLSTVLTDQKEASAFGIIPSDASLSEVDTYRTTADKVAAAFVADKNKLNLVFPCASATVKKDCAKTAMTAFVGRAYRIAVTAADVDPLMALYDIGAKVSHDHGIELAVSAILQSPRFLYIPEFGTTEALGSNAVKLSGYEVATRLSYAIWDSTPDAKLLKAAAAGELNTPAGVKAQLAWMAQDPKGKNYIVRFLSDWIQLDRINSIAKSDSLYPDWKSASLPKLFSQQADAFFNDLVTNQGSKLTALLTTPRVMINKDLAPSYGTTAPDAAFKAFETKDGISSGLLTLPAFSALNATATESSPIYRGRFVRERLLCQTLPPAPADIPPAPEFSAGTSTRERLKEHEVNAKCAGCHALMDPIGFGFENFDAIGRFRATDGGSPVDASGELTSAGGSGEGKFNGVAELGLKLSKNTAVQECMSRLWFRFMLDRMEQDSDSCTLRKATDSFVAAGTDMSSLPAAIIATDAFLYRRPIKK